LTLTRVKKNERQDRDEFKEGLGMSNNQKQGFQWVFPTYKHKCKYAAAK